ncbi:MAG: SpoIIE family protein phosphatase [Spirochaetes bacterium]|nr:SpoIIE family protein phosphatase [Spirochaetota bacterium]
MSIYKKIFYHYVVCLLCFVIPSCNTDVAIKAYVNNGIIDLRNIENTISRPINLEGTWKFYWHYLIENNDQLKLQNPVVAYITVPRPWNKQKHFKSYPSHGYGTYHITILHSKSTVGKIMFLKMPFTFTSHSVYINGILSAHSGFVATSKDKMIPNQLPAIIQFIVKSPKTDIYIQVANFQQRNGGIIHPIYYGTPQVIKNLHNKSIYLQLFVFASLFIIGIYHLGLYLINKSKQNIFLGLFSLIVALRILVINDMLLICFFSPPWGLNFRLSYLTITLSPILFCHFVDSLYKGTIKRHYILINDSYFGLFTLFVCVASLHIVSASLIFIQLALVCISFYLLIILFKETGKNLKTKRLFYFGLIAGFCCLINDIFFSHQIVKTVNTSHFGILIFVVTQTLIAFEEYINQQQRLIILSNEMDVARKIQRNILPPVSPRLSGASIDVLYLPVNSIGGDFYHFFNIDNKHAGIFIADVTGHGIPASIIASTVNIAFTLQYKYAEHPEKVLTNINNLLIGKTGNQPISALYCYLDTENMVVRFCGAGNPYPIYLNAATGSIEEIKTKGNVIGVFPSMVFDSTQIKIHNGDRIILYTDGLIDITNKFKHYYDIELLINSIHKIKHLKGSEFLNRLIDEALLWAESKENITDDITIITIDIG